MELAKLSIAEAGKAFRAGQFSPLDLTEAALEAIARLNPQLNAFLTVTATSALAQAVSAGEALARGEDLGPLQGIPLALKDLYDVAGVRTTAGSRLRLRHVAAADSAVARRIRTGGAVLLGKLHMHEWALGTTSVNPHFGPCRNPWDPTRIPGGSSGGSAAALAAGLCLGSFGSDTGGSIRIPAALCGVVGLKPTYGRVSLDGVVPLSWSLDHAGPMARTVRDVALLLQASAGYDPADPVSADVPVDDYLGGLEAGVRGLTLLLPEAYFFDTAEPEVAGLVRAAAEVLAGLGARLEPVVLPGIEEVGAISNGMNLTDAATYHAEDLRQHADELGEDVRARLQSGAQRMGSEYARGRQAQREWRRRLAELLAGEILLVTPTTATAALPIEGSEGVSAARRLVRFTAPFNFTGLPAISVPCGFTAGGLPVGMQLVGAPWAEARVLRAAQAYEQATAWHLRKPPISA